MRFSTRVIQSSKKYKSRNGIVVQVPEGRVYVYAKIAGKKTQVKTHFHLSDASMFNNKTQQTSSSNDSWVNKPLETLLRKLKEEYTTAVAKDEIITPASLKKWVEKLQTPADPKEAPYIAKVTEAWIEKYPNEETRKTYRNHLSVFRALSDRDWETFQ